MHYVEALLAWTIMTHHTDPYENIFNITHTSLNKQGVDSIVLKWLIVELCLSFSVDKKSMWEQAYDIKWQVKTVLLV